MDYSNINGQTAISDSLSNGHAAAGSHSTANGPISCPVPFPNPLMPFPENLSSTADHSMWQPYFTQPTVSNEASSHALRLTPYEREQETVNYDLRQEWNFDGILYPCIPAYGHGLNDPARARPRSTQSKLSLLQNVLPASEAHPPSSYLKNPRQHGSYMATPQSSEDGSAVEFDQGALYRPRTDHCTSGLGEPYPPELSQMSAEASLSHGQSYRAFTPNSLGAYDSTEAMRISESESEEDENGNDEPYAKLIHRALLSAPGHRMVLKQIYDWFEKHTDKPNQKNGSDKGWQNSIRHNLSMNGAFKKVEQQPPTDDAKKGYVWVLEDSAVLEGVKSTTRYRKSGSSKKGPTGSRPTPSRQKSGRKGGRATKKSKFKRMRMSERQRSQRATTDSLGQQQGPNFDDTAPEDTLSHVDDQAHNYRFHTPTSHPYYDPLAADSTGLGIESETIQSYPSDADWQSPIEPGLSLFYDESECSEDGTSGGVELDSLHHNSWKHSPSLATQYPLGRSETFQTGMAANDLRVLPDY